MGQTWTDINWRGHPAGRTNTTRSAMTHTNSPPLPARHPHPDKPSARPPARTGAQDKSRPAPRAPARPSRRPPSTSAPPRPAVSPGPCGPLRPRSRTFQLIRVPLPLGLVPRSAHRTPYVRRAAFGPRVWVDGRARAVSERRRLRVQSRRRAWGRAASCPRAVHGALGFPGVRVCVRTCPAASSADHRRRWPSCTLFVCGCPGRAIWSGTGLRGVARAFSAAAAARVGSGARRSSWHSCCR